MKSALSREVIRFLVAFNYNRKNYRIVSHLSPTLYFHLGGQSNTQVNVLWLFKTSRIKYRYDDVGGLIGDISFACAKLLSSSGNVSAPSH